MLTRCKNIRLYDNSHWSCNLTRNGIKKYEFEILIYFSVFNCLLCANFLTDSSIVAKLKTGSPPFCWLLLFRCCDFFYSLPAANATYFFRYCQQTMNQQECMPRHIKCQPSLPSHFTCILAQCCHILGTASTMPDCRVDVVKQPNTNEPPASCNG